MILDAKIDTPPYIFRLQKQSVKIETMLLYIKNAEKKIQKFFFFQVLAFFNIFGIFWFADGQEFH